MQGIESLFYIIILIVSVVIHEFAHGYAAYRFGDTTALYAEAHLKPTQAFGLAWFHCVTGTPCSLWNRVGSRIGQSLYHITQTIFILGERGFCGLPLLASLQTSCSCRLLWVFLFRILLLSGVQSVPVFFILQGIIIINIVLAVFNMVPIPPLDGSKILFELLSYRYRNVQTFMERYSIVLFIAFIFVGWKFVSPLVFGLFSLLTGVPLS